MVQSTAVSPDKAQMVQSAERERAIELLSLHKYIQYKYISSRMELELLAYKVEMQPRLSAVICISPFGQPHEPSAPPHLVTHAESACKCAASDYSVQDPTTSTT